MFKNFLKKISLVSLVIILSSSMIVSAKTTNENIGSSVSEVDKQDLVTGKMSMQEFSKKYPEIMKQKDIDIKNQDPKYSKKPMQMLRSRSGYTEISSSIHYLDDSNSCGGNQGWFNNSFRADTGCASVTAANILAYHSRHYDRSSLYPYSWNKNNYTQFQNDMYDYIGGPALLPQIKNGVINYTKSKGYRYSASTESCWSASSPSYFSMITLIKNSINSDNPVALLIGPDISDGKYRPYNQNFDKHWVTIIGYSSSSPNNVIVSSWGEQYDLNLYLLEINRAFLDVASFYKY